MARASFAPERGELTRREVIALSTTEQQRGDEKRIVGLPPTPLD
jgi:hypothetical protein